MVLPPSPQNKDGMMGVAVRYYILEDDGRIHRIPTNKVQALYRDKITLTEYSGKSPDC